MRVTALVFLFSIVTVTFKAIQGRNFAFSNYWAVIPTSICISASDLAVTIYVVRSGMTIPGLLAAGIGSGIGGMLGIWVHNRFTRKKAL